MRRFLLSCVPVVAIALASFNPVYAEEPAKPSFQIEDGRLVLPGPIAFVTGGTEFAAGTEDVLKFVKAFLDDKTYITLLRIEGHTDSDGDDQANQELSEKRAMAVAKWLVGQGIDCKRLLPVGFGENKPVASNETQEGKAANRRMEICPAQMKGLLIGGMPADGGGNIAGDPCAK